MFTDSQQDVLWALMHDKYHAIAPGQRNPDMDNLAPHYEQPVKPLFRGLTMDDRKQVMAMDRRTGTFKLDSYASFTESRPVAEAFGRDSQMVLVLTKPPKAFCYYQHMAKLIIDAGDSECDAETRTLLLSGLERETEWILPFGLTYKATSARRVLSGDTEVALFYCEVL